MKQYIDKVALVQEIERLDNYWHLSKSIGGQAFVENLLSFLDTLEVKEVDSNDTLIDRACELLARMIWEVTYEDLEGNSVQHCDKMEFIEDFKKYMKGGEE